MFRILLLVVLILGGYNFSFSQEADSGEIGIQISPDLRKEKERKKALEDLIPLLVNSVDSIITFDDQIGIVCAPVHDTLTFIRVVLDSKKKQFHYVIVKLKVTQSIESDEKIRDVYEAYIDLTFDRLQKHDWKFYEKKELPISYNDYDFVLIEEHLEKTPEDVVREHFRRRQR